MYYYRILSLATRKLILEPVEAEQLPEQLPQITEKNGPVVLEPIEPAWWDRD